jgi:hypothetical protein
VGREPEPALGHSRQAGFGGADAPSHLDRPGPRGELAPWGCSVEQSASSLTAGEGRTEDEDPAVPRFDFSCRARSPGSLERPLQSTRHPANSALDLLQLTRAAIRQTLKVKSETRYA